MIHGTAESCVGRLSNAVHGLEFSFDLGKIYCYVGLSWHSALLFVRIEGLSAEYVT